MTLVDDDPAGQYLYSEMRLFERMFTHFCAEALVAALVNRLFMLAVMTAIIVQAVSRFANPIAVQGEAVTAVALLGLPLNILVPQMLSHGGRDLNVRAALLLPLRQRTNQTIITKPRRSSSQPPRSRGSRL